MHLEDEIVKSFTLENDNWNDKWKHNNADWEEGNCYSSIKLIVTVGVLQLDDVHSSECIEVGPHKLVSVDEHGNQETEKKHIEDEHEKCDENLALWELILSKVLLTIEAIENV